MFRKESFNRGTILTKKSCTLVVVSVDRNDLCIWVSLPKLILGMFLFWPEKMMGDGNNAYNILVKMEEEGSGQSMERVLNLKYKRCST